MATAVRASQVLDIGKAVAQQVSRDDVPGLAAELAYRFFLALFPFLVFLVAVGAFMAAWLGIQNPARDVAAVLEERLPPAAAELVARELRSIIQTRNPGLLSVGILGAIWAATGGVNAFIKASNRAYARSETRPLWRRYVMAMALTLLAGGATILALVLFLAGQIIGSQVAQALGIESVFWTAYMLARWPVAVLLVLGALTLLYRFAPNARLSLRWVIPGAIFAVVGWLVSTYLFGVYVSSLGNFTSTYGAVASVAVLMIWFYLTAFILLLGLEVNEVLERRYGTANNSARVSEHVDQSVGGRRA